MIGLYACLGGCPVRSDSQEGDCPLCGHPMEPVSRGPGRPPLGDDKRKPRKVYLSDAEVAAIAARRGDLSLSQWFRSVAGLSTR